MQGKEDTGIVSGKEMKRIKEKRVEKEMWKRRVRMRTNTSSTVDSNSRSFLCSGIKTSQTSSIK